MEKEPDILPDMTWFIFPVCFGHMDQIRGDLFWVSFG